MSEMIERVARAIRAALAAHNETDPLGVDPQAGGYVDLREVDDAALARAAIAAMGDTPAINATIRTAQEHAPTEMSGPEHVSEIVRISQDLDLP